MARKAQQQQQDTSGSDLGRFAEDPAMSSVNADKFKAQMKGSDDVPETTIEQDGAVQPPEEQDTTDTTEGAGKG